MTKRERSDRSRLLSAWSTRPTATTSRFATGSVSTRRTTRSLHQRLAGARNTTATTMTTETLCGSRRARIAPRVSWGRIRRASGGHRYASMTALTATLSTPFSPTAVYHSTASSRFTHVPSRVMMQGWGAPLVTAASRKRSVGLGSASNSLTLPGTTLQTAACAIRSARRPLAPE